MLQGQAIKDGLNAIGLSLADGGLCQVEELIPSLVQLVQRLREAQSYYKRFSIVALYPLLVRLASRLMDR